MAFKSRLIMGIAIICSLGMLTNCAFPVRPGYDRKTGSYKRYRVPKQAPAEIDSTAINPQDELAQEEKLATISKTPDTTNTLDAPKTNTQDSTAQTGKTQPNILASVDSTENKQKNSDEQIQKYDNVAAKKADRTATKNATKKHEKTKSTEKKSVATKPTNLEKYAKEWLGAKYVYGAASKRKTDCSGYVMQVYKGFYGISLDHNAQHMFDDGRGYSIKRKKLKEGDLVFFGNFWKISHVGIYLKGERFIHASSSNGVIITPMDDNYWAGKYKGARRFK